MSSVINVRLNEKMTLRFVELYRDQRLLWDKDHEGYNKRADRLRAYRRIADGMAVDGMGVPEVTSKIKNIRSTYLQELKKIRDSARRHRVQHEDEDALSPYVPKLLWFPILDSMIGGTTVQRVYSSPSPSTVEMLSINYTCDEYVYTTADNGGYDPSLADRIKRSSSCEPPPEADTRPPQYQEQQSTTELFAKYVATSLDALPPRLAAWAQKDVHDVLVKYKLMELDGDGTSSRTRSPARS